MVISIVAILAAIGVPLLLSATNAMSFLTVRSDLDQSADVAMARMSREIRKLKDDESISVANASQFSFNDVDDNPISYSLSGTDLMRNTDILASRVDSLSFTYYDYYDVISTPPVVGSNLTDIRRIEVSFTFEEGAYKLYYKTQITPKNLRHLRYKFK